MYLAAGYLVNPDGRSSLTAYDSPTCGHQMLASPRASTTAGDVGILEMHGTGDWAGCDYLKW